MTLHRDDLIRMVELPTAEIEFRADTEGPTLGTLEGYAAVFNSDTLIDSWEGRFTERFMHGAFRDTLAKDGDKIKVLFNHGFDPSIGDKPLGKPRLMEEDDRGLRVEVPLDDTSYNRDLVASLRSGALDGMSIRFSVVREDVDDSKDLPVRTVKQARLYEFGPVTFPAYQATTAGIRGQKAYEAWRTAHPSERDTLEDSVDEPVDDVRSVDLDSESTEPAETDTSPTLEHVPAPEPALPVRRVDEDAIREKASAYLDRLEKIEEKYG